jgi:hypothetical protein
MYVEGTFSTIGGNSQSNFALFADRILPVTLSSFTHYISGMDVNLKWVTDNEIINAGFEILRSVEYNIWTKAGYINCTTKEVDTKDTKRLEARARSIFANKIYEFLTWIKPYIFNNIFTCVFN